MIDNIKYLILNDAGIQLIIYLLGIGVCLAIFLILLTCLMGDDK